MYIRINLIQRLCSCSLLKSTVIFLFSRSLLLSETITFHLVVLLLVICALVLLVHLLS